MASFNRRKLPYVEVLVLAMRHMYHIELQLGPGDRVGLLLVSADTTRQNFVAFWDWRGDVSVGVSLYLFFFETATDMA